MNKYIKWLPFILILVFFLIALSRTPEIQNRFATPESLQSHLLGVWVSVSSEASKGPDFGVRKIEITKQSEGEGLWTQDYKPPTDQVRTHPEGTDIFHYQIIGKDRIVLETTDHEKNIFSITFAGRRMKLDSWGDGSIQMDGPSASAVFEKQ